MTLEILAHRGYWKTEREKNSEEAFVRAFKLGFGIETDVRDCAGEVVISHDMPEPLDGCMTLSAFLDIYKTYGRENHLALAINVKADGLQEKIQQTFKRAGLNLEERNFFFFDMAVPDALGYLKRDFRCFTRYSEFEKVPAFEIKASGVWVDAFDSEEGQIDAAMDFLSQGRDVALVSPELHRRVYKNTWQNWKGKIASITNSNQKVYLCTDFPEEAKAFFYE